MTYCKYHKDNTKCPNFDINRIYKGRCLHIRFDEYCSWIKLKEEAKKHDPLKHSGRKWAAY